MKLFRSDSRIIFNVIIALILGILFGNFLGGTILNNQAINVNAGQFDDEIFILQTGIYYDEMNATIGLNEVKALGLTGLVVKEHNIYYVYLGIAYRANLLDPLVEVLVENDIEYLVKSLDLYSLLEGKDDTSQEYYFYHQSIKHFISLIHDKEVVFSEQYKDSITDTNLVVYNHLIMLNYNVSSDRTPLYRLEVYKSLVDVLM
ncbi:MAG: hypothetical protein K0Q49_822 [Haloplasmataceae bacterium]|jgi:hypothetical protein|nr:hypothetical protein [Haloplasmataceae bacterium]